MNMCTAHFEGAEDSKRRAFFLAVAEVTKVAEQSGEAAGCAAGRIEHIPVDAEYVGWIKGPQGKVVRDVMNRSCTRIDVDQLAEQRAATIKIYGTDEGIRSAKALIAYEVNKISPEMAYRMRGAPGFVGASDTLVIPNNCVGWLKGRQGAMVQDIEHRCGVKVEFDQTAKDLGQCKVTLHG